MEYEIVTLAEMREGVRQRQRQLENEHYSLVLNKLANRGNREAVRAHDENIAKVETAIQAMREEALRLDVLIEKEGTADAPRES